MSSNDLSPPQITAALAHLGSLLPSTPRAEMVLIGGAAGVLSGALPASRTTVDCDVLEVSPLEVFDLCRYHADEVARRFQIAPQWLDASAHALAHLMLPGWRGPLVA